MAEYLSALETPSVVIDQEKLRQNIGRVRDIAAAHGLNVRPHAKTHKCLEIARMQLDEGAVGLTCSKTDEGIELLKGGVPSITIAYPLIARGKVERLLLAARETGGEVLITVDSKLGVQTIAAVSESLGRQTSVFLKIDVGLHRCGVDKDDPQMVFLAKAIDEQPSLRFAGLLSHAGHAYGVATVDEVRHIAEQERETMLAARDTLRSQGHEVPEVSVGSTPTVLACADFEGITEIRPGNYVFMDRTPLRFGLIEVHEISLFVVATVVSRNDQYLIVDAGSKVLSSDGGGHGFSGMGGFGLAHPLGEETAPTEMLVVEKLSEEHGWIGRKGRDIPLGTRVKILPNHACVVGNLADQYALCDSKGEVIGAWRVAARGKVL